MDLMLTKHTKAINDNFNVLHKSIEKLSDRQDVTEKRQEQQDTLIAGLFDQLKTWREQPSAHSPSSTSSLSPPLFVPTTPHMSTIHERTPATSDLQPGSFESPTNVDADTPDTPNNPIPTPPPDPPTIALQRALRKSPTECNAKNAKRTPGLGPYSKSRGTKCNSQATTAGTESKSSTNTSGHTTRRFVYPGQSRHWNCYYQVHTYRNTAIHGQ